MAEDEDVCGYRNGSEVTDAVPPAAPTSSSSPSAPRHNAAGGSLLSLVVVGFPPGVTVTPLVQNHGMGLALDVDVDVDVDVDPAGVDDPAVVEAMLVAAAGQVHAAEARFVGVLARALALGLNDPWLMTPAR